jgi:nitrite reductase/ring-hydroxylating ferredoxin subunit
MSGRSRTSRFVRIAAVDEVPEGTARVVAVRGRRVVLFHLADGFHATDPTCALHGAALDRSTILDDQTLCPLHGAPVDAASGRCAAVQREVVRSYRLRVANRGVYLDLGRSV